MNKSLQLEIDTLKQENAGLQDQLADVEKYALSAMDGHFTASMELFRVNRAYLHADAELRKLRETVRKMEGNELVLRSDLAEADAKIEVAEARARYWMVNFVAQGGFRSDKAMAEAHRVAEAAREVFKRYDCDPDVPGVLV